MRKALSVCCAAVLLMAALAGCKESAEKPSEPAVTQSAAPTSTPVPTPPIPFTDVPENSNYYDAVVWAYENGVASGGDTFEPLSTCTRGQAITFLWRAMGSPEPQLTESPVTDIAPSNWFYKPVLWAYESGISTSSTFKPNSPCTNGEALTFLWRAEGKPMASVSGSAVALAASGAYYERPAAWADNSGLFAQMGTAFDPSAPCSRAYLVSYLHWADGQRASAEKDRQLQAEYEKIIQDAKLYEVHGSGLVYADYVDVDGDGTVELLTIAVDKEKNRATATVYASMDGHAKKTSELSFELYIGKFETYFSLCKADGQLYLSAAGYYTEAAGAYNRDTSRFYRIGKDAIALEHDLVYVEEYNFETDRTSYTYTDCDMKVSEGEFKAVLQKFTDNRQVYSIEAYSGGFIHISDRGLLPVPGVEVNGVTVKLSAAPYSSNNVLYDSTLLGLANYKTDWFMVPLRDVLEAMGVAVYANSDASVILASTKSDTLVISRGGNFRWSSYSDINSRYYGKSETYKYSMNGGEGQDIAVEFTNGKAFVPLQAIVSLFGAQAEWDGEAGAMQITSNIPDSNRMTQDQLKKMANFDFEQANQLAINKGYKGSDMMNGTVSLFEYADSFDYEKEMTSGLRFINGKAVWTLYAIEREERAPYGYYAELYRVDIASDGTVTAYPNERGYMGAGQL